MLSLLLLLFMYSIYNLDDWLFKISAEWQIEQIKMYIPKKRTFFFFKFMFILFRRKQENKVAIVARRDSRKEIK